jgi:Uma2 family endonuclease
MPTTSSIAHELWTADEFLDWLELGVFADLIDGEILMHTPVSLLHGNLTDFVDRLLAAFIEHKGAGGRPPGGDCRANEPKKCRYAGHRLLNAGARVVVSRDAHSRGADLVRVNPFGRDGTQ